MLQDRGYLVSQKAKDETMDEFRQKNDDPSRYAQLFTTFAHTSQRKARFYVSEDG